MGLPKEARRRTRASGQPGQAVRARTAGDPGHLSPGPHPAAAQASGERGSGKIRANHLGPGAGRARHAARCAGGAATRPVARRSSTRPRRGQRQALVEQFLQRSVRRRRWRSRSSATMCCGAPTHQLRTRQLPTFDLARSRYVIGFGADFLGTWNSPRGANAGYGAHAAGPAGRPRAVRAGRVADDADRRQRRRMGAGAARHRRRRWPWAWRTSSSSTTCGRPGPAAPARSIDGLVAGPPGVRAGGGRAEHRGAAERIERLAREFAAQRPAVAIIGGAPLAHTNGLFKALAVNALNALLGGVGSPGGVHFTPQQHTAGARRGVAARSAGCRARHRRCCCSMAPTRCLRRRRPGRPRGARKVPFIAELRQLPRRDERPCRSDPARPLVPRVVGRGARRSRARGRRRHCRRPVMRPLYTTRATPDVLLEVGRRLRSRSTAGRCLADVRGDAAGAGAGRTPRRQAGSAGRRRRRPRREPLTEPRVRRRRRAVSVSLPPVSRRRRSSTARWRTCRGCRSCRTR